MKIDEAIKILKYHNEWRRGSDTIMTEPKELGLAIDCVVSNFEFRKLMETQFKISL